MTNSKIVDVIHIGATAEKLWDALTNPKTLQESWGNIQSEWTQGSRVQEIDASGRFCGRAKSVSGYPMMSTNASAVMAPTPGWLISRTASGHCSTCFSMAVVSSLIFGAN
jgi:hypothetical protein